MITYGFKTFDKSRFIPVRNVNNHNKPAGGFWSCPENARHSWKDFCESERYCTSTLKEGFTFKVSPLSKVLRFENSEFIANFLNNHPEYWKTNTENALYYEFCENPDFSFDRLSRGLVVVYLDFERIALDYDALLLKRNGWTSFVFRGWDVDTFLVLNPDIVIKVEELH